MWVVFHALDSPSNMEILQNTSTVVYCDPHLFSRPYSDTKRPNKGQGTDMRTRCIRCFSLFIGAFQDLVLYTTSSCYNMIN